MHKLSLPLLVAACASGLVAQTRVVSPPAATFLEGTSANTHPLGPTVATSPQMRYLAVHDDMQGKPGAIKEMGFRLNAGATGVATNIVMEVVLSTAAVTSSTMSTTFDNNHGADKATVCPPSTPFNYAAYPPDLKGPAPFHYRVPFTTPFVFAGQGPICWEMRIASRTNTTSFSMDAASGTFRFGSVVLGTGCIATGRTTAASVSASLSTADVLTISVSNLTPSASGFVIIGTNDAMWAGVPLPWTVPSSTGAPSGTCNVWTDIPLTLPVTLSTTGTGSVMIPNAPPSGKFIGAKIYVWGVSLDPMANPFGVVTTNYRQAYWGDNSTIGIRRLYAFNNASAATGTNDTTGIVTEFVY